MTVKCPNCEWSAEVHDEKIPAGGGKGTCPKCQTKFEVHKDAKLLAEEPPDLSSPTQRDTRACPLCGEEILSVAKKCKHCQSMLDEIKEYPRPHVKEPNQTDKSAVSVQAAEFPHNTFPEFVNCLDCQKPVPLNDEVCPNCGLFNSQKYKYLQPEEPKAENNEGLKQADIYSRKSSVNGANNAASVIKTTLIVVVTLAVIGGVASFSNYHLSGKADLDKSWSRTATIEDRANNLEQYKRRLDSTSEGSNDYQNIRGS